MIAHTYQLHQSNFCGLIANGFGISLLVGLFLLTGCSEANTDTNHDGHKIENSIPIAQKTEATPEELVKGEGQFNTNCARCHGPQGTGTDQGPPLVHKIYEPNHHADFAFQRAAAQGVRAHHWKFGNMPKIEGISPEEVTEVIRYVRWLQQQAGIF
ncbi:MAG: c-type cytochrome [Nitrospirales bacterium]